MYNKEEASQKISELPEHFRRLEQLKQRLTFTGKKINALVYVLHVLSEEEIKIVEGGSGNRPPQ